MKPDAAEARGTTIRVLLTGSWRATPPRLPLTPVSLAAVVPALVQTGAAGLAWWRIAHAGWDLTPWQPLREAFQYQSLLATVHETQLRHAIQSFRAIGIDPVLLKGWAITQRYPAAGLRPYGDLDLFVPAAHAAAAQQVAQSLQEAGCPVDLHPLTRERASTDVLQRTRTVPLGDLGVRVFGAEDELRGLCQHGLGHGLARPLWLCDVAAVLETLPPNFDWPYFLYGNPRRAEAHLTVLGLAADFLGAQPPDPVSIGGPHTAPAWMRQCVLRRWGNPRTHRERLLHHLRAWTEVWDCLQACWPDPITATTELRASFLHGPRWPIQIAFCATRTRDILRDLLSGTTTDSPQDRVIA